ncbi:hypothetical protein [Gordonia humi]|uniref:Uncharacterized protein n=1 Tax=Gordonia humi TaxID=686429 RepID=A0A840F365_9ACTN|nr:hypothetical protein [Gordonia humi]MBB4134730.1 hypothetical protein [Gordonia humi]
MSRPQEQAEFDKIERAALCSEVVSLLNARQVADGSTAQLRLLALVLDTFPEHGAAS